MAKLPKKIKQALGTIVTGYYDAQVHMVRQPTSELKPRLSDSPELRRTKSAGGSGVGSARLYLTRPSPSIAGRLGTFFINRLPSAMRPNVSYNSSL